jgi:deoxyribodipyrimidine photolyase-related protein
VTVLRIVLGDQLTHGAGALSDIAPGDVVLMAEVRGECTYVKHHQKKLVLVLSAMRHFAAELVARGVHVDYVRLDDADNSQSLRGEMLRAVARHKPSDVVAMEAAEWRVTECMRCWHEQAGCEVEIRDDVRFLCRKQEFFLWAAGRRSLRMEFFYREMRRRTGMLMDGDQPAGGKWNFDHENRKRLPPGVTVPEVPRFAPDKITQEVMALVAAHFGDHFGDVTGFCLPVTAAQAEAALEDFVAHRLPCFGDWQDAMKTGAPNLFHSLISTSLNIGLLDPRAICAAAEAAYRDGRAPLNAVEGFVRQIAGWREFIRGIYWLHMPGYGQKNALQARRTLPPLYWSGDTHMNCLRQAVGDTRAHAYAHHIQRLMVTGNFALLAGIDPDQVDDWYMVVYADAYEWVEMPNTRGMALFADGGVVGSKPYAASGAYIDRMSDYCKNCFYDVKDAVGERACPFNYLYWDFMARHEKRFAGNPRMAMPLRTLARMEAAKRRAIEARAASFFARLDAGETM